MQLAQDVETLWWFPSGYARPKLFYLHKERGRDRSRLRAIPTVAGKKKQIQTLQYSSVIVAERARRPLEGPDWCCAPMASTSHPRLSRGWATYDGGTMWRLP